MTPQRIIERLLKETAPERRETILRQAAQNPACTDLLLETAQALVASDPAQCLLRAETAAEIAERRDDFRAGAQAGRLRAQGLLALGRHADALAATQSAAERAQQTGDAGLTAQVQISGVVALGWLGRYEEAFALGERLSDELRAANAEHEAARVLVNLGILRYRQDQYALALAYYDVAASLFTEAGDTISLARTQVNQANALTAQGQTEAAITLLETAQLVFAAEGMTAFAATAEINLGFLHAVSGRYTLALALLDRARARFTDIGDEEGAAQCDTDSGDVYRALNLLPDASECYTRAIRAFETQESDYDLARAASGFAAVRVAAGELDAAQEALGRAERIFESQKNTVQRAFVRLRRAELLSLTGQEEEAQRMAQQAARVFARRGLSGWAAEARFLRAEIALNRGEQAARTMLAIARIARRERRGQLECRAENALGYFFVRQGKLARALRHYRASVAVLEAARAQIAPEELHVAFLHDKVRIYEDLVGALLARGRRADIAEALEVVERSRSRLLLERVQSALMGGNTLTGPTDTEVSRRLNELRAALSRSYYALHSAGVSDSQRRLGSDRETPERLTEREQAYHRALRGQEISESALRGAFFASSDLTAETLQRALLPDETLLTFYTLGAEICAFVLTPKRVEVYRGLACLEEVQFAARRLRFHLQRITMTRDYTVRYAEALKREIQEVLQHLYALLLRPLAPSLTDDKVIVVPHGALHGLPFHAFLEGETFALDRWEWLYAPGAAVWHAGVRRRDVMPPTSRLPALLMGVPDTALTHVEEEITRLNALWPGAQRFCGQEATEVAFRAHAPAAQIIHLATHAVFRADNPLFSGLQFADGWLLARDLYALRLDCELATLAACGSGVSRVTPGDELFGLLRGFLAAGARSVAASLWAVDDAVTALLMGEFYTGLRGGKSKAAALRAAQQRIRAEYSHPYFWAAFALAGER
jgi:tetratricopeptide (TPR) repeat protein